ncbi:hypothetical protein [Nostoc sp. DedQUE09]|uniref:hypothetical protein n=1 Tax=Nostoc sp. DedQUE09 TaxID=3075394 RepID=UPI002AD554A6|nr:hypothetical protein [Nostoc sp. DedQUE09]MDZ7950910.1 hypothetical protein [Nostoc sp. DedQUE09]
MPAVFASQRNAQRLLWWQRVFIIKRSHQTKTNPKATSDNSGSNLKKSHHRAMPAVFASQRNAQRLLCWQ